MKKKIIVVFKTHYDVGFTELSRDIISWYGAKMMPDVVRVCRATEQDDSGRFVWTMPSWPLLQSMKEEYASEETITGIQKYLEKGQIAWLQVPFTTHTEFCGVEDYIRGMYFSGELSEKYQRYPISAKMTDVPGHTWMLPTLLAKSGVRFLHLGCNSGCIPPRVPRLFYWEGPDGSRVLTYYNKGGYGTPLLPTEDWKFPVWLTLTQTNDNLGPQSADSVREILDAIRENCPDTEVQTGTLDDFYRELEPWLTDDIPVIRGDLADTWIHGTGTYPMEVAELRQTRNRLRELDKALSYCCLNRLLEPEQIRQTQEQIRRAYEACIVFGEHTWGLNTFSANYMGSDRYYDKKDFNKNKNIPRMEESWVEQADRAHLAAKLADQAAGTLLQALQRQAPGTGEGILVWNGEDLQQDTWIRVPCRAEEPVCVRDPRTGEVLDSYREADELCVRVHQNGPGLQFIELHRQEAVAPETEDLQVGDGVIENKWYRIEADPVRGGLKSLYQKENGRQWVDPNAALGFGQYVYDLYGIEDITEFTRNYSYRFPDWQVDVIGRSNYPEQEHKTYAARNFTLRTVRGQRSASFVMTAAMDPESIRLYGNAATLETTITVYADREWIDFDYQLRDKGKTFMAESGHFVFPLPLEQYRCKINKMGCVLDAATDIVENANHALYCCENWLDMEDDRAGLGILTPDATLFSLGGSGIYQFYHTFNDPEPVVYCSAFNNAWGCNFPQWMGGDYHFRYRLYPHQGDWAEGKLPEKALQTVVPSMCCVCKAGPAPAAEPVSLVRSADGLQIQTIKPAEDGRGYILRLRELYGQERPVRIVLGTEPEQAVSCTLLERDLEPMEVRNGGLEFTTHPFEIHTIRIVTK